MEALQYLKDKYGSNDNSLYFREPDLPLSTSLERICKYMQEYAESHTAAHTAGLRERVKELEVKQSTLTSAMHESLTQLIQCDYVKANMLIYDALKIADEL